MKNRVFIFFCVVLLSTFVACKQKSDIITYEVVQAYYNTGEVFRTIEKVNKHEIYARAYWRNGNLQVEGMLRDSLKDGVWKTYYSDGILEGEYIFSNNKMVEEIIRLPVSLEFKEKATELQVGHFHPFRVRGAGYIFIESTLDFGSLYKEADPENPFTFGITPLSAGTDSIAVVVNRFNDKAHVFLFTINVVK
jgi:hypothetical protein